MLPLKSHNRKNPNTIEHGSGNKKSRNLNPDNLYNYIDGEADRYLALPLSQVDSPIL
jgi:hypothetical protein